MTRGIESLIEAWAKRVAMDLRSGVEIGEGGGSGGNDHRLGAIYITDKRRYKAIVIHDHRLRAYPEYKVYI